MQYGQERSVWTERVCQNGCRRQKYCEEFFLSPRPLILDPPKNPEVFLITESPVSWSFPEPSTPDYFKGWLKRNLKKAYDRRRRKGDEFSPPWKVFDFILATFGPVFEGKRPDELSEAFLDKVY